MIKKIFYSYSHKDKEYLKEIQKYLKPAIDEYNIDYFVDEQISAGDSIDGEIMGHIDSSDLIILLISANYLSSDYCRKELDIATNNNKAFPIILEDCDWKNNKKIYSIKVLPEDGKPINNYGKKSKAYDYISKEFRKKIECESKKIALKEDFKTELEKIDFVHPIKKHITLSETFVMPNIKKGYSEKNKNDFFEIKNILSETNKQILFIGQNYSGKTSLLKYIYLSLIKENKYPIYIRSSYIVKTKHFEAELRKNFMEQYDGDFNIWKKFPLYILIDDYTHSVGNFIDYLRTEFNCNGVIITIEEDEYVSYFRDFSEFSNFEKFTIKAFNKQQQEDLIKKWIELKDENIELNFYNKVDIFEEKLNSIISSQFILPPYPANILLILQSLEQTRGDMKITSYGYCYHALILNYFVKNGINIESSSEIDAAMNFLSELSYSIFNSKQKYMQSQYNIFKKEYRERFVISDGLIKRLDSGDYPIFYIKENEGIKFTQEFIYYYFLGKILSEKITTKDIEEFCDNIHLKINMYIIIFIIHHSKHMELVDEIILRCMTSLNQNKEATYSASETHYFINHLNINKLILNAKSIDENRKEQRILQDKINILEESEDNAEELNNEVYKGMKFAEVLGQILKNRSGSFEKNKVKEIVNSLIELQLRANHMIFEICKDKDIEKYIIQSLKEFFKTKEAKKISDEKAKSFVQQLIKGLSLGCSMHFVNYTSFLIYTENIINNLEDIVENTDIPSREIILFLTSIKHEFKEKHLNKFKTLYRKYEKNNIFFAKTILSLSIQHYLNTHQVRDDIRYDICVTLDIPRINPTLDRMLRLLK
ncbi:Uncharacterized protein containing a TIR (Toll-Interleukin 1-resistance) domain [Campylobacter lari]|uniref:toll/interleukin-1 receptor domain-containing protein n=1 Tax=Campylobacter lari TaxID=201 RepID=UPI000DF10CDA|nr:toll/interleukin-1 receptor domain-containing protein [Campylobacter lari]STA75846.1 Uncharacterized protein containing a TIR (Toll-Interleukin 1-resistance) domain [Campylobacter lari]